jgi:hypothetical protein
MKTVIFLYCLGNNDNADTNFFCIFNLNFNWLNPWVWKVNSIL